MSFPSKVYLFVNSLCNAGKDDGIFSPEIQLSLLRHSMAANVVFSAVEHALASVAVQIWVVELVLHLSPDVVEEILTLLGRLVVERSLEVDALGLLARQVYLLDAAIAEEEVLHVLVGNEAAATDVLHHQRGGILLQVVAPEVITALKGSLIVDFLALGVEDGIAHARGVDGEAHDAVTAVVDVKLQWLHLKLSLYCYLRHLSQQQK